MYKFSYKKKEINENVIVSLINSNLLPKDIITKEINHYETEPSNIKLKRNKSNYYNSLKINNDDLNLKSKAKTPSKDYLNFNNKVNNRNIVRNLNEYSYDSKNKKTNNNRSYNNNDYDNDNDIFTPYGYDINKSYNFNKKKLIKDNSRNYDDLNYIRNINKGFLNSMNDYNFCYDLITTQEENILLKTIILNLAKQNEKIIDEIDNIVKVSGMCTIDVTTEGIKHLEQIIFNNRDLLEKNLEKVKNN